MSDYIPAKDALADSWSTNFATLITANPTTYGLTAPDAVAIQTAADDYALAYATAINPPTRTSPAVAAKDVAKATMESVCRPFAMQINANAAVTDLDRVDLGLTVRAVTRTPTPPPTDTPILSLRKQIASTIVLSYRQTAVGTGKAKPAGTRSLRVIVEVAEPADPTNFAVHEILTVTKSPFYYNAAGIPRGFVIRFTSQWVADAGPGGITPVGPVSVEIVVVSTT